MWTGVVHDECIHGGTQCGWMKPVRSVFFFMEEAAAPSCRRLKITAPLSHVPPAPCAKCVSVGGGSKDGPREKERGEGKVYLRSGLSLFLSYLNLVGDLVVALLCVSN